MFLLAVFLLEVVGATCYRRWGTPHFKGTLSKRSVCAVLSHILAGAFAVAARSASRSTQYVLLYNLGIFWFLEAAFLTGPGELLAPGLFSVGTTLAACLHFEMVTAPLLAWVVAPLLVAGGWYLRGWKRTLSLLVCTVWISDQMVDGAPDPTAPVGALVATALLAGHAELRTSHKIGVVAGGVAVYAGCVLWLGPDLTNAFFPFAWASSIGLCVLVMQ